MRFKHSVGILVTIVAVSSQCIFGIAHAEVNYLQLRWSKSISTRPGEKETLEPSLFKLSPQFLEDTIKRVPSRLLIECGYSRLERAEFGNKLSHQSREFQDIYQSVLTLPPEKRPNYNGCPYGINPIDEAVSILEFDRNRLHRRTLELLTIDGGHGNFVPNLSVLTSGWLLPEVLRLASFLNSKVMAKLGPNGMDGLQRECNSILSCDRTSWTPKKYYYVEGEGGRKYVSEKKDGVREEDTYCYMGISLDAFTRIQGGLASVRVPENSLQIKTKCLELPACYSAAFIPILEPLVAENGVFFCNLDESYHSSPIYTEEVKEVKLDDGRILKFKVPQVIPMPSLADIVHYKRYDTNMTGMVRAFLEYVKSPLWLRGYLDSGVCGRAIVVKHNKQLVLHCYHDPKKAVSNPKFREVITKSPAIGPFAVSKYLSNNNEEEAHKVNFLLQYLKKNGILFHFYDTLEKFETGVLEAVNGP